MSQRPERTALITGASRGIGRACALALADGGCHVAIGYREQRDTADAVRDQCEVKGVKAVTVEIEMSDRRSIENAVDEVRAALGDIDVLVNNAGIVADGLAVGLSPTRWTSVMRVNLDGTFYAIQRVLRPMIRQRWGRIVNVGSVSAAVGARGQANYAAAKAGIVGLSRTIAAEYGSRGITCNVVVPGAIETDMTDGLSQRWTDAVLGRIPAGRLGTPAEVGAVVAFLASEQAAYVNGTSVRVDGGLAMGM